jgi:hypothetical protein
MALGQLAIHVDQLEADDLQASIFITGQNAAGQLALDAIRLDEDECSLGHWTDTPADG